MVNAINFKDFVLDVLLKCLFFYSVSECSEVNMLSCLHCILIFDNHKSYELNCCGRLIPNGSKVWPRITLLIG